MSRYFVFILLLFSSNAVFADISLPHIFGDHMVLQRDKLINVWGWASPREKVTVQFNGQSRTTTASKTGTWKVTLDPTGAGGPYQLIVRGKNTITLSDVLVGEVWICSGQSNMEWTVANSMNAAEEIRQAKFPTIRHIKVPNRIASEPQSDIADTQWKVCAPENAAEFTAVGYFFARMLTKELGVPVGLINSSWGGTHSETWTSRTAFEGSDEFKDMISKLPRLNLDSLARKKGEETLAKMKTLQGGLPSAAEVAQWKSVAFSDDGWRMMNTPGQWEGQDLPDFDGVVWIRKTVELSADDAAKSATIELAMIDDSDVTYVNGVKVGETISKWNEKRNYNIAPGILKAGKNVIAVRIDDTGGGGGVHGEASNMYLRLGATAIPLAGQWHYRVESMAKGTGAIGPNSYPTLLFNAMINPILQTGIRGVIWYQGESNAGRSYQYRTAFPLMIQDWRKHFSQGDFPFYFVQLSSYNSSNGNSAVGSGWAELREAQTMTLRVPNTGMAVTTDIGDPGDIHPRNKQDVGKRLAAIALNRTYSRQMLDGGPVYKSMQVDGDRAILTFENLGGGLLVKDKYGYIRGFEVAGADQKFYYAQARVEGNKVIVHADAVRQPLAVRYGWADDASECNLFNVDGFPASPFRTDDWKGITEVNKFQF